MPQAAREVSLGVYLLQGAAVVPQSPFCKIPFVKDLTIGLVTNRKGHTGHAGPCTWFSSIESVAVEVVFLTLIAVIVNRLVQRPLAAWVSARTR